VRFELPTEKKWVHEMQMPIRWGDMDAMGHVNNTIYFRYMETVRLDWLFANGAELHGAAAGPVIVNAFCNFVRQLVYPGDIVVSMYVGSPGRSSFDTFHTISRVDEAGVVYAQGGATVVWTDHALAKSMPMPEAFRAKLV
jgi:acyl-CoA thioester hydrolase